MVLSDIKYNWFSVDNLENLVKINKYFYHSTYFCEKYAGKLLEKLRPITSNIIVVDNCSTDDQ